MLDILYEMYKRCIKMHSQMSDALQIYAKKTPNVNEIHK